MSGATRDIDKTRYVFINTYWLAPAYPASSIHLISSIRKNSLFFAKRFMFTRRVRFVIIAGNIIAAILGWRYGMPTVALLLLLSALFIAWGLFRHGTVYLAGRALKRQKLEKAARLLADIRYPERLSRTQRSYYYFHQGVLDLHAERMEAAKQAFGLALDIGLRTPTDEAATYINLGVIAVKEGNKKRARQMLKKVKKLKYRPHLKTSIAILERHVGIRR